MDDKSFKIIYLCIVLSSVGISEWHVYQHLNILPQVLQIMVLMIPWGLASVHTVRMFEENILGQVRKSGRILSFCNTTVRDDPIHCLVFRGKKISICPFHFGVYNVLLIATPIIAFSFNQFIVFSEEINLNILLTITIMFILISLVERKLDDKRDYPNRHDIWTSNVLFQIISGALLASAIVVGVMLLFHISAESENLFNFAAQTDHKVTNNLEKSNHSLNKSGLINSTIRFL